MTNPRILNSCLLNPIKGICAAWSKTWLCHWLGWHPLLHTLHCPIYWSLYQIMMILDPEWNDVQVIPIMHIHVHVQNTLVIQANKCRYIHTSWSWDLVEQYWFAWVWTRLGADWDDTISCATLRKLMDMLQGYTDVFDLVTNLLRLQILAYLTLAS